MARPELEAKYVMAYDMGYRNFLAFMGSKWVHMIATGDVAYQKVKLKDYLGMHPVEIYDLTLQELHGRLIERADKYERLGVSRPYSTISKLLGRLVE